MINKQDYNISAKKSKVKVDLMPAHASPTQLHNGVNKS